jgi:protein-S-isoprenylcysteine O-methyltransferase Ste14
MSRRQGLMKTKIFPYFYFMTPHRFFALAELVPWLVLFFYWLFMWNKAKPMAQTHPDPWVNLNRVLVIISMLLLGWHRLSTGWLGYELIPRTLAKALTGLAVTTAGVAFAIWARKILADNWSAQPTLKQNHELIMQGPYKIVRHPIYTGILIAVLGTAIMVGQVRGFVGFAVVFFALWHKSLFEEDLMCKQFGEQYQAYTQHVKGLIPWIF